MKLTSKGRTFALLLILSALFSYLIIFPYYFPYFGISLSLVLFAIFAYGTKKQKTKISNIFFIFTLLFASFISIRSEGLLTFFNVMAALYFGSLIMTFDDHQQINGLRVITSPFFLVFKGLFTSSKYKLDFREKPQNIFVNIDNVSEKIIVGCITLLILIIIPPILASANPIFSDRVDTFYNIFDLKSLFDFLFSVDNILLLQRLLFFFALFLLLPRMITYMNKKDKNYLDIFKNKFKIELSLPKAITALILLLFFVTQFQLYFSSQETLAQMGYSYSEYTNEVFGQLSVVSVIIILLIYYESRSGKYSKALNYLLILQGVFLVFMAFKSDYEYSYTYGFTYKRLYGFAVVALLLGTYLLQYLSIYKKLGKNKFIYFTVIYFGIILMLVNLFNFDYLIYHYRKSVTGQGVDHEYLSRLSSDSLSYKQQLKEVERFFLQFNDQDKARYVSAGNTLTWKIEKLQKKYSDPDLRKINLLEYYQYKEIKDINIDYYWGLFTYGYELPKPLDKRL